MAGKGKGKSPKEDQEAAAAASVAANVAAFARTQADGAGEEEGEESNPLAPSWDEKFETWVGGLGVDAGQITIYAYSLEKVGGTERRRQEFVWKIGGDGEYPDLHEMGITLGAGDFDLIGRAAGKKVLQKRVYFGPAYNQLKDETLAAARRQARPEVGTFPTAPAPALQQQDPFAFLERLGNIFVPIAKEWMKNSNPMNQVRAMSEMGEQMAKKSFDFSMETTKRARDKILENIGDDDDETTAAAPGTPAAAVNPVNAPGWEAKLSQVADILISKGQYFLDSSGPQKTLMKKMILNDEAFQTLLANPESTKAALTHLYKKCGVEMVNEILTDLGIMPPKIVNGQAKQSKQKA